ncbi:hypothetical protein PHLCEN_2v5209 [Hermanssonia centrifuga]|uniref:Uncharacterized protein n=1 Tax=Hermanssonia centrifuga TaxID=98765 RepID=A0A2R6P8S5_9APHY|nr:hypothetical protein PHLCEN_2v5209 [Hermanssonia centrifuga]
MKHCFWNEALINALDPVNSQPKANSAGVQWGVHTVMYGVIAFAAIIVHYLLSPDKVFKEEGEVPQKISYKLHAKEYIEKIIT